MKQVFNDNDIVNGALPGPDAHGQAAILLVESLIHVLIARAAISVGDAVEAVTVATDVMQEIAADHGSPSAVNQKSLNILNAIGQSLATDLAGRDNIAQVDRSQGNTHDLQ